MASSLYLSRVFGLAYSVVLWKILPRTPASSQVSLAPELNAIAAARKLFATQGYLTLLIAFGLKSVADWLVYTWMPLYLFERFHMSLTAAGFAATIGQAASVCGILLGGSLADRWALRSGAGRLLTQALGLAAAAPFLFLVGARILRPFC